MPRVIVEMRHTKNLAAAAFAASSDAGTTLDASAVPKITGVRFDPSFAPATLPGISPRTAMDVPYVSGAKFDLAFAPEESTYIVRAEVDEPRIDELRSDASVVGVYADVEIQPAIICPGSTAMGTDGDIERLLCTSKLQNSGMDGAGVLLAIVDTGLNLSYLAAHGKTITLDSARSWVPNPGMIPGDAPVGHGTMCAFDAAIAAPKATFLDIQVLRSTAGGPSPMSGVLSDAVRAYAHLCDVMRVPMRPGENRSLVVSNSWAMFHPSWDFPVGNPGNYSDNPNHPFNRIVATLEQLGADILFAAGNCGCDCSDGRCQGICVNSIYGANGHPSVLTVAGVDITKARVGYSSQGPGRLSRNKPDLCGYTHFKGSEVYPADGGTSAATPVVAGVVAAVRSKRPYSPSNPAAAPTVIRALMRSTAEDQGTLGFDFDYGFGVVDGCALQKQFQPYVPIDICIQRPWLCPPRPKIFDICRRYPWICQELRRWPIPPRPGPGPDPGPIGPIPGAGSDVSAGELVDDELGDLLDAAWQAGYHDGQRATAGAGTKSGRSGCGCSN